MRPTHRFPDADLKFAANTLASVVRSVHVRRAIQDTPAYMSNNFWRIICAHLFDDAVVKWCIMFGSHHEQRQPLHWKNLFQDEDEFRGAMLQAIGLDRDAWDAYATELRVYRDQLAAHQDLNPEVERYPNMDTAVRTCFYYYERLRPLLMERGIRYGVLSLEEEAGHEAPLFQECARLAVAATRDVARWRG